MLYAQVTDRKMEWPPAWEKSQHMFKYLNRMTHNYQLGIERRMLYSALHPEYRCVLIEWESVPPRGKLAGYDRKREVLLETTDPAQMEAALFMLINEVEPAYKEAKRGWVLP